MAERTCPLWVGYLLASPIRNLIHDPYKILKEYVRPGMITADFGPGMGFFSIPMAKIAGNIGSVICVDVQKEMLDKINDKARKKGLESIIQTRFVNNGDIGIDDLDGSLDFILAFAVVHEIKDQKLFFEKVFKALKPRAGILFSEPKGHVSKKAFEKSLELASNEGFFLERRPEIKRSHSAFLIKRVV